MIQGLRKTLSRSALLGFFFLLFFSPWVRTRFIEVRGDDRGGGRSMEDK